MRVRSCLGHACGRFARRSCSTWDTDVSWEDGALWSECVQDHHPSECAAVCCLTAKVLRKRRVVGVLALATVGQQNTRKEIRGNKRGEVNERKKATKGPSFSSQSLWTSVGQQSLFTVFRTCSEGDPWTSVGRRCPPWTWRKATSDGVPGLVDADEGRRQKRNRNANQTKNSCEATVLSRVECEWSRG